MQAQLDKSAGQLSRVQKEKENIQQEMERFRDKHDKNQARKKQPPQGFWKSITADSHFLFCFNQSVTLRLQKERDAVAQEVTSLREKLELVQSQVAKATRDRELLLSETESSRERFDKVNQSLVKVQVRPPSLFSH